MGGGYTALVQFDLGMLPAGTTASQISKATLRVYCNRADVPGAVQAELVGGTWTELGVTYATLPALGAMVQTAQVVGAGEFVTFDVTSAVQGWVGLPGTNFGLALVAGSGVVVQFDSKENDQNTAHAPELEIALAGTGAVGPQGPAGAPRGRAGPQGIQGETGATGAQGPQGPPGIRGRVEGLRISDVYAGTSHGAGRWCSMAGRAGYRWWRECGKYAGFVGTTWGMLAAAGEQGPMGPARAAGPQGPMGMSGQGPAGPQGVAGPAGATGPQGPQGESIQGPAGPQGPQGVMGPAGSPGLVYQGMYSSSGELFAGGCGGVSGGELCVADGV